MVHRTRRWPPSPTPSIPNQSIPFHPPVCGVFVVQRTSRLYRRVFSPNQPRFLGRHRFPFGKPPASAGDGAIGTLNPDTVTTTSAGSVAQPAQQRQIVSSNSIYACIYELYMLYYLRMLRTTINLPVALHHQLHFLARGRRTTLSQVVRDLLETALATQDVAQLDRAYEALRAIKGTVKGGRRDASTRINEMLYGEQGSWKGSNE